MRNKATFDVLEVKKEQKSKTAVKYAKKKAIFDVLHGCNWSTTGLLMVLNHRNLSGDASAEKPDDHQQVSQLIHHYLVNTEDSHLAWLGLLITKSWKS